MKKERDTIIVGVCIIFTVFLCGIFIGRAISHYPIDLTATVNNDDTASTSYSNDLFIGRKMNINVATADELTLIPSVGKETAEKIVDYRTKYGAFQSLSELRNVDGLGSDRILQLIDYITVGGTYEDTGR